LKRSKTAERYCGAYSCIPGGGDDDGDDDGDGGDGGDDYSDEDSDGGD